MEEQAENVPLDSRGCVINILSPSEPNSPHRGRNASIRSNCSAGRRPFTHSSEGPLHILHLVTDTVLIIGAAIFIISIVIVFSIVVLAVIRVYSLKCYYDANLSMRFMTNVNNSCEIVNS